MPYIKKDDRKQYEEEIQLLLNKLVAVSENNEDDVCGHMNYIISSLLKKYVAEKGERYFRYNDLIGMLECVKLEMYRRQILSYEDKAIEKNGDI